MPRTATYKVARSAFGVWAVVFSLLFLFFVFTMAQSTDASEFVAELWRNLLITSPFLAVGLLCCWVGTHVGSRHGHPYIGGALALPAWLALMLVAVVVLISGAA